MEKDNGVELEIVSRDLECIEVEIVELQRKRAQLRQRKEQLLLAISNKRAEELEKKDWGGKDYPWSSKLSEVMKSVFGITTLRPHQLETMNAVLAGQDVILLMPTGGGKSLCFQLPALVTEGFTLVVSPLVALMEDQIMALKRINVAAEMINASTPRPRVTELQNEMINPKSKLKLLYCTPEKLAKSKMFMTKLQKSFQMKRLDRIAIDEVHCCSQWGHDFRKDYKFLGVLKNLFPTVPIIGLTATAPSKVLGDVQQILNIEGCIVFRASFNRPNLFYEVRQKPSVHTECVDELERLLTGKYRGQSGIIYTTSIKDTEELMRDLRVRGLKIGCYHANLEPEMRSKCHQKWTSNYYQAVVATIAFGMGMDKPDVRFVIHHSISKSMANFYQESGRAGRDDQPADCIVYYRLGDVFRLSTMVFSDRTGLENLYGMVSYCIDSTRCRRQIIADHFEETWESIDCIKSCDHCKSPRTSDSVDITSYCRSVGQILSQALDSKQRVTAQKLVDAWQCKGQSNLRVQGAKPPALTREMCERVVAFLLVEGYLKEDFHFTPYTTLSYILAGSRLRGVVSGTFKVTMDIPGKTQVPTSASDLKPSSLTAADTKFQENKDSRRKTGNPDSTGKKSSESSISESAIKKTGTAKSVKCERKSGSSGRSKDSEESGGKNSEKTGSGKKPEDSSKANSGALKTKDLDGNPKSNSSGNNAANGSKRRKIAKKPKNSIESPEKTTPKSDEKRRKMSPIGDSGDDFVSPTKKCSKSARESDSSDLECEVVSLRNSSKFISVEDSD